MRVGTRLVAPEGCKNLPKEIEVHFLKSDSKHGRVWLVHFTSKIGEIKANLFSMNAREFEDSIRQKAILLTTEQSTLPPWLSVHEGRNFEEMDAHRKGNPKISLLTRVEERLLSISVAVSNIDDILSNENPEKRINQFARESGNGVNETRFRTWLLSYIAFGRDKWALLPPFHHIGNWDRLDNPKEKLGAPSLALGRSYGSIMTKELAEKCVQAYLKYAQLGKTMKKVYIDAIERSFNCVVLTQENGLKRIVSRGGEAFPTYDQFRYQVIKKLGQETVQKKIYGEVRYRTKIANSKGRYSEEIANLMERIEVDGYYTNERPVGFIEGSHLPSMCVVVGRDLLSGKKLGIGFSFGAERHTAYRMMLFSMAIPKDHFCRLFGVTLKEGEWVSQGLPSHISFDRGPGSIMSLIQSVEHQFPIRDLAESWQGQSKATIESSHPNQIKIEGQPTYLISKLTPIQLARQEISRLILFNNTANMEDRLDPGRGLVDVIPSPSAIWKYYDEIYRNDAQPISFEDAVRTFLTPVEYQVKEDAIYFKGMRFVSDELKQTGLFDMPGVTRVKGYHLDMCFRYVWVEVRSRLYEVPASLRITNEEEATYICLEELIQWEERRCVVQSGFRVHQQASSVEMNTRFRDDTKQSFDNPQRHSGRAKKTSTSKQEAADIAHSANLGEFKKRNYR